jgi:adenylate cyclase
MGIEIERKFLVVGDAWRHGAIGTSYRQGYLSTEAGRVVRVRVAGAKAFITVKGAPHAGVRPEYEYEIPLADANEMLDTLCHKPFIEKQRFRVTVGALVWEIDVFAGENTGLVLAEVELAAPDQPIEKPAWAGAEVTADPRYSNAALSINPYRRWSR